MMRALNGTRLVILVVGVIITLNNSQVCASDDNNTRTERHNTCHNTGHNPGHNKGHAYGQNHHPHEDHATGNQFGAGG